MRKHIWMVLGLASVLSAGVTAGAESPPKAKDPVEIVTNRRSFRIPFAHVATAGDLGEEFALFVSTDRGKTWELASKASKVSPEQQSFTFRAPRDGVYWFAVKDTRQPDEADTKLAAVMSVKVDTGDRAEETSPAPAPGDQVEEARLSVELLELELSTKKTQLRQYSQMVTQFAFGFGGMGGGMGGMGGGMGGMGGGMGGGRGGPGGGFVGGAPDPEQRKKSLASMRERYEELKSATLETGKKLGQARQRLATLEGRTEHSTTADNPPASDRGALAEQRARLSLLEIAFEVDSDLLREAMKRLGTVELERILAPLKGEGAEDAAKGLLRLRDYIEEKKLTLVKRGVELDLKKQELEATEERLKELK